jgi:hypothetical protein
VPDADDESFPVEPAPEASASSEDELAIAELASDLLEPAALPQPPEPIPSPSLSVSTPLEENPEAAVVPSPGNEVANALPPPPEPAPSPAMSVSAAVDITAAAPMVYPAENVAAGAMRPLTPSAISFTDVTIK